MNEYYRFFNEWDIGYSWAEFFEKEAEKQYFKDLMLKLKDEYKNNTVYPAYENIFNAFKYTDMKDIKVVILGQDPYHEPNQAHGLSFSVNPGIAVPRSLKNIYKELNAEMGLRIPDTGYLKKWAAQGVLLLNAILTVRTHDAMSHKNLGWTKFTDNVIEAINDMNKPVVYMLWGNKAIIKKDMITNEKQLCLTAAHPSPLSASRGFFGCNHFIKANEYLKKNGLEEIDWQI